MQIAVEVARLYAALGYHIGEHEGLDFAIMDAQTLMVRMCNALERLGVTTIEQIKPSYVPPQGRKD